MASRLIAQPTAGFAPSLTRNSDGPITSVGSGSNQMLAPRFSEATTNSPFETAGPVLGGLMGAILANRSAVEALEADRARKAAARPSGSSSGAAAAAAKAASDAAKRLFVNQSRPIGQGVENASPEELEAERRYGYIGRYGGSDIQDATADELQAEREHGYTGTKGPQFPYASPDELEAEREYGYTGTNGIYDYADEMIKNVLPDYNAGTYQDDVGNLFLNGSLVNNADIGAFFPDSGDIDFSSLTGGGSSFPEISFSGPDYSNLEFPSSIYDSLSFPDISFSSPDYSDYNFSSPTYDNDLYFPDVSFSMPDFSDFDFGFKNGGMVPMMKKGGLASFDNGGMVNVAPETQQSFLDSLAGSVPTWLMDYINSASNNIGGTVLGAGAGAALGNLLSGMTQNVGGVNQGVDMSKIGVIAPHTTTFGMGPTRHVGYDEYGSPSGEDVYADTNLYQDLGTPQNRPMGGLSSVQQKADGGAVHFTYGTPVDPMQIMQGDQQMQGMRDGGTPQPTGYPEVEGRMDLRQGAYVQGKGDGQSDDIPAMLADGEYVFDADTVAAFGNGSNKAGAEVLDKLREQIRRHKRSAPVNKIPPPAKSPLAYLKGIK